MVLALERTLKGDPGKTLDSVQKKGLSYFLLHLIEETKKPINLETFFPYSEKKSGSVSQLIL